MYQRLIAEYRIYGINREMQRIIAAMANTEHPIYGQLGYIDDPIQLPPLGHFGLYRFVLKPEANHRSTFAPNDTYNVDSDDIWTWENIRGVLATNIGKGYWFDYVNDQNAPIMPNGFIAYIEAQILGGVFINRKSLQDVEYLYYPETDEFYSGLFSKIEELARVGNFGIESY